jgi:hypothetical protein
MSVPYNVYGPLHRTDYGFFNSLLDIAKFGFLCACLHSVLLSVFPCLFIAVRVAALLNVSNRHRCIALVDFIP